MFKGQEQQDEQPDIDVFKQVGDEKKGEAEDETLKDDEEFLKLDEGTATMVRVKSPK